MDSNIFSEHDDNSKIWIYQSKRDLTDKEAIAIHNKMNIFLNEWDSHGSIVKSAFTILYNRFIVILADDTADRLCGSAGDRLLKFFKELDIEYQLSFMDRMLVSYRKGEEIETLNINDFRDLIQKGEITENTIVFNNILQSKKDFLMKWEVPVKESWHKQLIEITA